LFDLDLTLVEVVEKPLVKKGFIWDFEVDLSTGPHAVRIRQGVTPFLLSIAAAFTMMPNISLLRMI
jgi:hypothetical protein